MLISVHLPKTAGASFGQSLKEHFGSSFHEDYGDFPINTPAFRRNIHALRECAGNRFRTFEKDSCIHGHFLPLKYLFLPRQLDVFYITWMRDPVERLASHYHYWKRVYDPATAELLQRRVVDESWSFERFALGPELRNFYCQFLWGFPLEKFDFIGITEHYEEDLRYFSQHFLGSVLVGKQVNVNQGKERHLYVNDACLRARIEEYHWRDMVMYRKALSRGRGI